MRINKEYRQAASVSCTETGSYHFAFQDSGLSDFQTLLTYKIRNNVNVAVIRQVKWKPDHFWLPSVAQKRRVPSRCSLMWTQLEAVSGEETASIYCRIRTIWTLNMFSHLELKLPLLYLEFQTYFRAFYRHFFESFCWSIRNFTMKGAEVWLACDQLLWWRKSSEFWFGYYKRCVTV